MKDCIFLRIPEGSAKSPSFSAVPLELSDSACVYGPEFGAWVKNRLLLAEAVMIYYYLEYKSCLLQNDWRWYIIWNTLKNEKKNGHMKLQEQIDVISYLERAEVYILMLNYFLDCFWKQRKEEKYTEVCHPHRLLKESRQACLESKIFPGTKPKEKVIAWDISQRLEWIKSVKCWTGIVDHRQCLQIGLM